MKTVSYVEVDTDYCGETFGVGNCRARLRTSPFVPVSLDASDVLKRGAGMTGAVDSKMFTLSYWVRRDAAANYGVIIAAQTSLSGDYTIRRFMAESEVTNNKVYIEAKDASGNVILSIKSSALSLGEMHHVLVSIDLSNTSKRHLYVDGVSDLATVTTYTDAAIDFTVAQWTIGGYSDLTTPLLGELADVWFMPGVYMDLSIGTNRDKFRNPLTENAADLGATGSTPTGSAPLVYLGRDLDTWHTNKGTGGGFTASGTLTAGSPASVEYKCFNTLSTCADLEHYNDVGATIRFAGNSEYLPPEIDALAMLTNVTVDPGRISLGENLGERPRMTVTLRERPHSDTGEGFDKYHAEREYDPYRQGTALAKWRARHPYLENRSIRYLMGELGQTIEEMEVHSYVIESFNGPTEEGVYTITAKDPLKLLDGDRALCPERSNGYLGSGITNSATSLTLLPVGIGDHEYPASGKACISSTEVVSFTRSGDTMTITRAQNGTLAKAHETQAQVQLCKEWTAVDPAQVIDDLMEDYGDVDPAFIEISDWLAETNNYYRRVVTGIVTSPTSVRKLIVELVVQCGLVIWWDPVGSKIRLQVMRQILTDAARMDEDNIDREGFSVEEQSDKRLSDVTTFYSIIDVNKSVTETTNYTSGVLLVDTDNLYPVPRQKEITTRWIPAFGRTTAQRTNDIWLGRFRVPPRLFRFRIPRRRLGLNSALVPELGGGYQIAMWPMQDARGIVEWVPIQITRLARGRDFYNCEAEEVRFTSLDSTDLNNRVMIIDTSNNVNLRTAHDLLYPPITPGATVTAIINSGASVGSTSVSIPALDTGNWDDTDLAFTAIRSTSNGVLTGIANTSSFAVGMAITGPGIPNDARISSIVLNTSVTIDKTPTIAGSASLTLWTVIFNIQINGLVSGKGGDGGRGKGGNDNPGDWGQTGGNGLKLRLPTNVSGNGKVQGGGGGGGGEGGDWNGWFGPQIDGGGGGGGAGLNPGLGAVAGDLAMPGGKGKDGTLTTGGVGGPGTYGAKAGDGGSPGNSGTSAGGGFPGGPGAGGKSVDGDVYLRDTAYTGTYLGSKI